MEIGEERREAQILHFNNGLGHRGIDQAHALARASHVAAVLEISVGMSDQGGQDFALHQQGRRAQPEQDQDQGTAE